MAPGRSLVLSPSLHAAIVDHAAAAYPEECCGILLGESSTGGTAVTDVVRTDNARRSDRHRRYAIAPEEILSAQKRARTRGLEIVGYYHSHPGRPARPSRVDREYAWPEVTYLIVSLGPEGTGETRAWRLESDGRFAPETLVQQPPADQGESG